jgi:hypothetical protein
MSEDTQLTKSLEQDVYRSPLDDEIEKFIDTYVLKDKESEKKLMDYLSREFANLIIRFHKEKNLRQIVYKKYLENLVLSDLDTSTSTSTSTSILSFWTKVFEENNTHFSNEALALKITDFSKLRYTF